MSIHTSILTITTMKNKLILILLSLFILSPLLAFSQDKPKLVVFHSLTCHNCVEIKRTIIPKIEEKFKDLITIEYRDIADIENYKLMLALVEKERALLSSELPVFYCEGHFINGERIKKEWEPFILQSLSAVNKAGEASKPEIDLISRFKSFKVMAIVGAGLIDGINPCAFTVIVFFISFLALQGYIKRELTIIGLTFILAVFLTYLLIGLGAFNFLYRVSQFWVLAKVINISIGIFCVVLGFLAIYDFLKFKKTGKTEGLALQLPQAVKNQIHKVVGMHYRVDKKTPGTSSERRMYRLIISALVTGFLVSLLEAVCTGQTYLPTITFILKTAELKLHAAAYLLLYNIMFVIPLFVIFLLALFGVSSGQFSDFLKKHLLVIKILMAILFFGLGALLIWRA